jgi:hypothetical protein
MKTVRLLSVALPAVLVMSCSQSSVTPGGAAGASASPATGGGSSASTGGSTSSSGGSTSTVGTGGSPESTAGGSTSSGGSTAAGGTSSGGSTTTSGGATTTTTGGTTASGGTTTASGGAATAGGGGTTARGGAGGAGGTAAGTITVADLAGIKNTFNETLASSYFVLPCYSTIEQDCNTIPTGQVCNGDTTIPFELQGTTYTDTFKLGGTVGTTYNMTFNVTGIAEGKYYTGGKRDGGLGPVATAQDANGSDTFYEGGMPVAVEHYNVYKLVVRGPTGTEVNHYYLNSFPQTTVAYENHQTFPIKYTKTIPVPGGGSVDLFMGDSNCRAVNNCGPGVFSGTCTASRNVPEANFVVPTTFMGKSVASLNLVNGASQPYHAQIIHILVTAVAPM